MHNHILASLVSFQCNNNKMYCYEKKKTQLHNNPTIDRDELYIIIIPLTRPNLAILSKFSLFFTT